MLPLLVPVAIPRPNTEDAHQQMTPPGSQLAGRPPIGVNSTICPLAKPLVLLKAGRAGSSAVELGLVEILKGCLGYQEISHDDALVRPHGCTPEVVEKQTQVWREALMSNAIISHNPVSRGGGPPLHSNHKFGLRQLPLSLKGTHVHGSTGQGASRPTMTEAIGLSSCCASPTRP